MYLYDEQGKQYLDFSGQFSACTLGHGNEELIGALKEQMVEISLEGLLEGRKGALRQIRSAFDLRRGSHRDRSDRDHVRLPV